MSLIHVKDNSRNLNYYNESNLSFAGLYCGTDFLFLQRRGIKLLKIILTIDVPDLDIHVHVYTLNVYVMIVYIYFERCNQR